MKKYIYNLFSGLYTEKWNNSPNLKILIETNKYFTKDKWDMSLNKIINHDSYEVKYYSEKFKGYKLIPGADALFSFGDNSYYNYRNLKLIYYGVSYPVSTSIKYNAEIYYAKGFSSDAIAEYCLLYSLLFINESKIYLNNQIRKIWKQNLLSPYEYKTIINKKIGILGLGNNGCSIAGIFRKNGCLVYGFDLKKDNTNAVDVFCKSKDELFKESDILIIAVNPDKENRNLINENTFSFMKKTSIILNVSRGNIINEDDLYKALKNKTISGAVLDVASREPLSRFNKLWNLDNIIITPHISGNINMFTDRVISDFIEKLNSFFK